MFHQKEKAFTLVEFIVVFAILAILFGIVLSTFISAPKKLVLDRSIEEITNVLRNAQQMTIASEETAQYGVYFDDSSLPHKYIIFKGETYESRDPSFDKSYLLDKNLRFLSIYLLIDGTTGTNEVVFKKITGEPYELGYVIIGKEDWSELRTIDIWEFGFIGSYYSLGSPGTIDSRHVHVDYERFIDIATETITLSFDGGAVIQDIPIAENIIDEQIYWEGIVDVGGDEQTIKIHTHRLNNYSSPSWPSTIFCIHRDRRYNNRSLKVEISGDSSGYLIQYSEDGSTTDSTSSFTNAPRWQ